MLLEEIKKVHFVGIGGVGMSALAQLYLSLGKEVTGSDIGESPTTKLLQKKGVEIHIGHSETNLPQGTDLIVYSDAVKDENVERVKGKELGIPQKSYFEALGVFANTYNLIAVCGAHGKTTTTAMLIDLFEEAGTDPMGVVGSLRVKTKTNFREGKGEYFIVEADEYMGHFLYFEPKILVITNIDADHLDYYENLFEIQMAFNKLAMRVPARGFIICDPDDKKVKPVLTDTKARIIDYKKFNKDLKLKVPGEHNRKNAAAALATASAAGVDEDGALESLKKFSGTWRRFEYKGETKKGALIYDDYAHHPTEIEATLNAAREAFPTKEITLVFQPHLYSRTKLLWNDFAKSLSLADKIILAPIYAAREKSDGITTSKKLADEISKINGNILYLEDFKIIEEELKQSNENELILTMGAGDIYKVGEELLDN